MSVKITEFNVMNHREAVKNRCNSYKSDWIVLKFYKSTYLMMFSNIEFVKYSASTHFAHFQRDEKVVRNGSMVRNGSRWCEMGRFLEFRTSVMKNGPFSLISISSVCYSYTVRVSKS